MKILFIVLCSLMFFCSCRGDRDDAAGGKAGDTNQTGDGTSGTQGPVQSPPPSETIYTLSIGSKNMNLKIKHRVSFIVPGSGTNEVSKRTTADLREGLCVEYQKKDFSRLKVLVNHMGSGQGSSNQSSGGLIYGCGPGQDTSLCMTRSGNWLLTLVADCWPGGIACDYTLERTPQEQQAEACLKMEDVEPSS